MSVTTTTAGAAAEAPPLVRQALHSDATNTWSESLVDVAGPDGLLDAGDVAIAGRDDAVIKSLDDFRPRGVAGVTTLSNGQIVLILDMKELLADLNAHVDASLGVKHAKALEISF